MSSSSIDHLLHLRIVSQSVPISPLSREVRLDGAQTPLHAARRRADIRQTMVGRVNTKHGGAGYIDEQWIQPTLPLTFGGANGIRYVKNDIIGSRKRNHRKGEVIMAMVKLTIDGKDVLAPEANTILQAARSAGIRIPTLCFHDRLKPIGSCGICVVEVDGNETPVASCETPIADGMSVTTYSERLFSIRQEILKSIL
ncbi:MAG TPA: hypothetical protein DEO88_18635, partial [Syntrophobacteraceae bacterium]|nr:hypothetical protein [Syntrophobacteraceae bacterium]